MIIDGRKIAREKEIILKNKIAQLKIRPKLATILVGEDKASRLYVQLKQAAAQRVGIGFEIGKFADNIPVQLIEAFIQKKNSDPAITGVIVQLPIQSIKPAGLINQINPQKDVDCLTPTNLVLLQSNKPRFLPATLKAVLAIIRNSQLATRNSYICVVGATGFVGKPVADYLEVLGAKVDRCNAKTFDLADHTRQAEILISATGVPGLIKKDMVKPGSLIIDVGSPQGDVDFAGVKKVAGAISPVPGGVGPLTVVSLLENVFLAAQNLDQS
jgi:methylenetetrahydrofolate dehydrogenase (NADP+)/methenyltetrahydrofolate cyclohydrolase